MPERPSLAAIPSLRPIAFSGEVFRAVPAALGGKILSTEGNRYYPGRYHIAGETGILYTSLDAGVAVREITRHAAQPSLQGALAVGSIKVRLEKVLDLTSEANLRRLGLSQRDLISTNRELPQAVSLVARRAGFQGLLVPSATGEGNNLVVFENNLGEGCSIEVKQITTDR